MVLFKSRAHRREVGLRDRRIICSYFRHIGSQQRPFRFTAQRGYLADVPLKFTAVDLRSAEGAGARRVFLQRRATARTMQRGCLFWRGRKDVALSFQYPALTDVITHLAARVAFARRKLRVVGVKFNTD